jgi:aspartate kinase
MADAEEKISYQVYKFGGASVKDAAAVRNVSSILRSNAPTKLVVVISAMGKTTNALEEIHKRRFRGDQFITQLQELRKFHDDIATALFSDLTSNHLSLYDQVFEAFADLLSEPCEHSFDQEYDRVVSWGELFSTALIFGFLQQEGFNAAWIDARRIIRTDQRFRDARVDWRHSAANVDEVRKLLEVRDLVIIQGYIGSAGPGLTTTLGREGSDFTASIMAYLLDAESVTIWKDVPGMLNADPKWFKNTVRLKQISFKEAIELAYYGASVIHPKTIKPLQNKNIPLFIRSFLDPTAEGSVIHTDTSGDDQVASFIFRPDQVLISISPRDFSFIVEDNLRDIFDLISHFGIRISLMENSAISFSVCVDEDEDKLKRLFESLNTNFIVKYNRELTLITVRHYNDQVLNELTNGREVLLEQRNRHTVRMIVRAT